MKDRQGVMRGKCNECNECTEYVAPSTGARCDYCDHVPTKHVQIIKLGPCKKCDGECEEYISDEKTSYTDCQYCGCKAADHKGAEKHLVQSITLKSTNRITSVKKGTVCKYPGCDQQCFSEAGKAHKFCGRTHALQYNKAVETPSMAKQSQVSVKSKQPQSNVPENVPGSKLPPPPPYSSVVGSRTTPKIVSSIPDHATTTDGSTSLPPPPSPVKICYDCRKNPANKGYNICEQCYVHRTT